MVVVGEEGGREDIKSSATKREIAYFILIILIADYLDKNMEIKKRFERLWKIFHVVDRVRVSHSQRARNQGTVSVRFFNKDDVSTCH